MARRYRTDWYPAKRLASEALGRVTSVTEDPGNGHLNYQTTYTYDSLDSLRKVIQGSQTRYFGYDSLKRLIRVKNPEQNVNSNLPSFTDPVTGNTQWAVGFVYDNNSNLLTKTDPRNITCTYTYDAMNRVLSRTYFNDPNQTPAVDYKYDGAGTNGQYVVGKLTAVNTSGSLVSSYTYDTFDPMGRVLHSTQTTDGNVYNMSYGYDLAGNLISETYPSNRVVSTAFDVAGRINDVSSGSTHYASSFSYSAHGGVTDVKLGNNLWEHTTFEPNRLQPTEIDLGSSQGASDKLKLNYDYGALSTNNGNVIGQTITIPSGSTLTQSYSYDALNRLKDAKESNGSSWIQTFLYDACGNRTIDQANTMSSLVGPNPQISSTTNRIVSAGYSYDYAGNLKTDAAGHSYGYDANDMLVKYDTTVALYSYDGEGHRVKSVTNNQTLTTIIVYDAMGRLITEYTNTNPTGGGTSYLTQDALGSPRVITASNQSVKARHDYLPFGEEISVPLGGRITAQGYVADTVRPKFTGQLRDQETGLDYFGARYYSCATGRFCSADSVAGNALNPQSLNRYAYVLNNPLSMVDPTGHEGISESEYQGINDKLKQIADQEEAERRAKEHEEEQNWCTEGWWAGLVDNTLGAKEHSKDGTAEEGGASVASTPGGVSQQSATGQSTAVTIYYWGVDLLHPLRHRVGHIAMQLSDGTYISLFPKEPHRKYEEDRDAEGREADRIYEIYGLNEKAIAAWWKSANKTWGYTNNCSDIVGNALRAGGLDALARSGCGNGAFCTPGNIEDAMIDEAKRSQATGLTHFFKPAEPGTIVKVNVIKKP